MLKSGCATTAPAECSTCGIRIWLIGWLAVAAGLLAARRPAWALRGGAARAEQSSMPTTGQPLACRMHLMNQARKAQKPPKVPFWHDHFVFDGSLCSNCPTATTCSRSSAGPNIAIVTGHFTINENAKDSKTVELNRFVDMAHEGWWSGDLEVVRPPKKSSC